MHTSEVLYAAADLIEDGGWAGRGGGWSWQNDVEGLCLEGAIQAASGADPLVTFGCPAYAAMAAYLGDEAITLRIPSVDYVSTPRLYHWNDRIGRTAAEVIEVLRATAVIEAAKEQAASDLADALDVAPVGVRA